jgi:hypothetical protein
LLVEEDSQDAEATGLWQFETGEQALDDVFDKFDMLLSTLERQPWLDIGGLADKARSARPVLIDQLPAGQANWMADTLRSQNLPWGEKGYVDWFDYAAHAAKNIVTREMYAEVSRELRDQESRLTSCDGKADRWANREINRWNDKGTPRYAASTRLFDLAVRTLVAHQYEFGCTGLNFDTEAPWQLARSAFAVLWASRLALQEHPDWHVTKADVNRDGIDEIAVVCGQNAYVFAPKGGRLLYWFNLQAGVQLVGNQNALCYYERYRDDHSYVPDFHIGEEIFPELKGKPEIADLEKQRYVMRRRCLNDTIALDDTRPFGLHELVFSVRMDGDDPHGGQGIAGDPLETRHHEDHRLQFCYCGRLLDVEKTVRCLADGLEVSYSIRPHIPAKQLRFRIENEITPDYLTVLDHGKQGVEAQAEGRRIHLVNPAQGCAVVIEATGPQGSSVASRVQPGFLAWLCDSEVVVDLTQVDQPSTQLTLSLRLVAPTGSSH